MEMTENSFSISNVNKEMKRNPRCYVKKWTRAHGTEEHPKEWTLILFVCVTQSGLHYTRHRNLSLNGPGEFRTTDG